MQPFSCAGAHPSRLFTLYTTGRGFFLLLFSEGTRFLYIYVYDGKYGRMVARVFHSFRHVRDKTKACEKSRANGPAMERAVCGYAVGSYSVTPEDFQPGSGRNPTRRSGAALGASDVKSSGSSRHIAFFGTYATASVPVLP